MLSARITFVRHAYYPYYDAMMVVLACIPSIHAANEIRHGSKPCYWNFLRLTISLAQARPRSVRHLPSVEAKNSSSRTSCRASYSCACSIISSCDASD